MNPLRDRRTLSLRGGGGGGGGGGVGVSKNPQTKSKAIFEWFPVHFGKYQQKPPMGYSPPQPTASTVPEFAISLARIVDDNWRLMIFLAKL